MKRFVQRYSLRRGWSADQGTSMVATRPVRAGRQGASTPEPPQAAPTIPSHLDGYELGEQIGSGGSGDVYAAVHSDGTRGAAKVQRSAIQSDFANQVKALERLKASPHIVDLLASGEIAEEGSRRLGYAITEMLDPRSLGTRIGSGKGMSVEKGLSVIRQICAGLRDAHAKNVVHLDIKPDNVLFDETGTKAKLVDFDIAKIDDQVAHLKDGNPRFSNGYSSPEHMLGQEVGPVSDTFSVASVAFETLTGSRAFREANPLAVLMEQPVQPSRLNSNLPPQLDAVLALGLAKDPAKRPSVETFAQWLDTAARNALPTEVEKAAHALLNKEPWATVG
ncbi:MAG: serine/threonine-protein kinase [Myxococcaceae bacterium]